MTPMRTRLPAMALAAVLTTGAAVDDKYQEMGMGTTSCGTWTAARRDKRAVGYEQWVLGFLSGIGYAGGGDTDPLNKMDREGVWAWIDNYCRANPIEKISRAAKEFFFEHPH